MTTPIKDLDSLPYPDWDAVGLMDRLDNMRPSDSYALDIFDKPRAYPLIASRSCPYNCTFCYHPLGQKYRQRSIDSIMAEIEYAVKKYRVNIISIYDELFSQDEERLTEFCRRFRELQDNYIHDIKWSCQLRVDKLTFDQLKMMKDSGCYFVSYGFESYSKPVLDSMKKHIRPEQIHTAIHMTKSAGISMQANFIFGDVAETPWTAEETLDFWQRHKDAGILLGFIFPFPDSKIYRRCLEKGIIKDKLEFIKHDLFKVFNMTNMDDDQFRKVQVKVIKAGLDHYPQSNPMYVDSNNVHVVCPHCHEINKYRNYDVTSNNYTIPLFKPSWWMFNKLAYCRSCRGRFFIVSLGYRAWSKFLSWTLRPWMLKLYRRWKG